MDNCTLSGMACTVISECGALKYRKLCSGTPLVRVVLFLRESGSKIPCTWCRTNGIYKGIRQAVERSFGILPVPDPPARLLLSVPVLLICLLSYCLPPLRQSYMETD